VKEKILISRNKEEMTTYEIVLNKVVKSQNSNTWWRKLQNDWRYHPNGQEKIRSQSLLLLSQKRMSTLCGLLEERARGLNKEI
jgi:hypothetical protein